MKKFISILLIIIALIAALCIWQKNNIDALIMFITKDEEGVNKVLEETKDVLDEKIKEYAPVTPRYFTPEEEEKIASGELTIEEADSLILAEENKGDAGKNTENKPTPEVDAPDKNEVNDNNVVSDEKNSDMTETKKPEASENNPDTKVPSKAESEKTADSNVSTPDDIIRNYTARFYALKAYYIGQLNQLEATAKNEYINARKENKSVSKTSLIAKYMGRASALQGECDGKVSALLEEMKAELKAAGGDLSVIDTIRQTYEAEKAARKAQYMNQLK